ncbi:MAG TPA: methyltransferase [Longimicrobiales bacterium]|nr:methyltransferase [Longimicrobiales bacterium]
MAVTARTSRWIDLARSQIDLLHIAEGFFGSRILFALTRLGVFETIGGGTLSAAEIGARTGADVPHLTRLLRAGVLLELLASPDGVSFRVPDRWQPLLSDAASETYLGNWLRFLSYLNGALGELDRAVTAGGPAAPLLEVKDRPDLREFTLAMHNYAALRGRELQEYLDTSGCRTLLDVGCGPGTYAFQLGLRNPDLVLHLVDLPEILEIAAEVQARYPLRNTVHYLAFDLEHEDITGSYDLVLVSNTLHMLGEQESRRLMRRLYHVVAPGGSLVVQAQYLDDDRMGGRWPIFLDLVQLCLTREGRNHTVAETTVWLEEAGFTGIEFCSMSAFNTNAFLRAYRRPPGT